MNKYYSYPNIDLWQTDKWTDRVAPISHLIEHIQEITPICESDYVPSFPTDDITDPKKHKYYNYKLRGYDDPEVSAAIRKKGLEFHATSQGGQDSAGHPWFLVCPDDALRDFKKLPVLIAFDVEDESSPLWMMRAVHRYNKYINMLSESRDFILAVLVNELPGYDKIYFNIMQEFSILFPCDINKMYLDVNVAVSNGRLSDVPGFTYSDRNGTPLDPDSSIENFGSLNIPVLNISGRWGNCDSLERALVMTYDMNEGRFDREWLIHSEVGKRMMQDMQYEYKYDTVMDPAFIKEMEDKGLVYEICYNSYGDRYIMAFPRESVEKGEKIPLVLVLQEVYEGNEHLAVTAHSYLAEWLEIAAQGECGLMFYVLEDIVSNERAIDMIKDNAERYPIDFTRVYATGHSHDGYFAYAMANKNPDFFAGIAILGNNPCPKGLNAKWDFTQEHTIIRHDIPTVVISGLFESYFPEDENEKLQKWVPMWKFFMKNHNIPPRTDEEILSAFTSDVYEQRITCLAGDTFRTLWADGIENYIVDFKNTSGQSHLRVIRQQNMPHTVTPLMCSLSWDFLRRFKRDKESKKIIELY